MSDRRGLSDSEVERVRVGIRELLARHRDNQAEVQRATGIRQQNLSKYLSPQKDPPGIVFAEELAVALGKHPAYFRDWFQAAPEPTHIEYDPRYPNFAEAARLTMQAVEGARASLKSHGDLSVADWLEEIRSEQRRLGAQARDAVGTAAKAEASAKAADEQRKIDEARVAAGQTGSGDFRKRVAELERLAKAQDEEPARRSMVPSSEPEAPKKKR